MKLNNDVITIETQTIASLLESQDISSKGIALAVNNKVIKRTEWDTFMVTNEDNITIITAAYGG